MAKILVAGCGDIGHRLAEILIQQGHRAVGLKRNPPVANDSNVEYYPADLTEATDLSGLETDFDQVFFLPAPDDRSVQSYRAVYRTGLNNLLNRFSGLTNSPQWFLVSSTSVYGQTNGEWVDEQSPAEPKTETGRIIRQAEQTILEFDRNAVVVRFSGIYGRGRERLVKIAWQQPAIQYAPPSYTNRIHQDDCAAVLAFLSELSLAGRKLEPFYLASDDNPAPLWDVISWLAEQLNRPAPTVEKSAENPEQNKRCNNARIKELGYHFKYPDFKAGYRQLIKLTTRISPLNY